MLYIMNKLLERLLEIHKHTLQNIKEMFSAQSSINWNQWLKQRFYGNYKSLTILNCSKGLMLFSTFKVRRIMTQQQFYITLQHLLIHLQLWQPKRPRHQLFTPHHQQQIHHRLNTQQQQRNTIVKWLLIRKFAFYIHQYIWQILWKVIRTVLWVIL